MEMAQRSPPGSTEDLLSRLTSQVFSFGSRIAIISQIVFLLFSQFSHLRKDNQGCHSNERMTSFVGLLIILRIVIVSFAELKLGGAQPLKETLKRKKS